MKKDWILTIGIDKYRLTEKEAQFYLLQKERGVERVKIGTKFLNTSFQSLVNESDIEEAEMIKKGKIECSYGKWHYGSCACGLKVLKTERRGGKFFATVVNTDVARIE